MVECTLSITHCLRLNLQLHTIDLVRTCRISSFCTVAWQLARSQLTRCIARSLGDSWTSCLVNMDTVVHDIYFFKIALNSESSALLKMSDMVGIELSQKPRRLHRVRNESSFARSDAEQRPDHAGRQYVILARMVARNTSWSDSVEMPWPRRTLITYSKLLHDVSKLFTWSVALSRSLSVMPRTLAQPTRSMFGHGGGGWDDWTLFSRRHVNMRFWQEIRYFELTNSHHNPTC